MLKISVLFLVLFKLINTYKKYTKDLTRYNIDNKVFHDTDILSVFPDEGVLIEMKFPKSNIPNPYFIFDYYFPTSTSCTINVLNQTFSGIYNKIAIQFNNTDEFLLTIQLENRPVGFLGHYYYVNFIYEYSYFPYIYYYTNGNFSADYNFNDEFRMMLNIKDFEKDKTYYLFNSFHFIKNPEYKLFETEIPSILFDFSNYDGELYSYKNNIFEFKKTDDKYNFLVLSFKGDKNYTNSSDEYGRNKAFFAILESHEFFNCYPIIPSLICPFIVILITGLLYYKFQYIKRPIQKEEKDLNKVLIEN